MMNPLFKKGLTSKVCVSLELVELIQHPDLLIKYYCLAQPLLMDALSETQHIIEQLNTIFPTFYKAPKSDSVNTSDPSPEDPQAKQMAMNEKRMRMIAGLRTSDHLLYKVLFELAHAFKEVQRKKYQTIDTQSPFLVPLSAMALWHDRFIPQLDQLFMKLWHFEGALVHSWEAYDRQPELFTDPCFIQGRLGISLQFSDLLENSLVQLLNLIKRSKLNEVAFDKIS